MANRTVSDRSTDGSAVPADREPRLSSVAVYVCTHRRNGPLARMLESLNAAAAVVQPEIQVAVVVVDDNPDGSAKEVVDGFDGAFVRGLHYRFSGSENISTARNVGLEAGLQLADWVAMTDDDQTVSADWIRALADVQAETSADAVTGPVTLRYPEGSGSWLTDQPFTEILEASTKPDGSKVDVCSTGNSMIRSSFLIDNPDIRFRTDLGKLGGEDMVFYREAIAAGLDARYSNAALCFGEQPVERTTYRYQVRSSYWLGNTEYVTNIESGEATKRRLVLRGARLLVGALIRPGRRLAAGEDAQWRFCGASLARSVGMLVGVFGIKVSHK